MLALTPNMLLFDRGEPVWRVGIGQYQIRVVNKCVYGGQLLIDSVTISRIICVFWFFLCVYLGLKSKHSPCEALEMIIY